MDGDGNESVREEGARARRQALLEIVEAERVSSQSVLIRRLAARGHVVTQSSVSRDLGALGVTKVEGAYARVGGVGDVLPMPLVAAGMIRSVAAGPHMLVIHTTSGLAQAVCASIDEARWPEVVGTVAGNDTIFCACRGHAEQRLLQARLRAVLARGK